MNGEIFGPSTIDEEDLGLLLEGFSFPLTKAELIHNAEAKRVPQYLLGLLRKLPSRFYHSKNELVNRCEIRRMRYREFDYNM
jgi:hypothetical protein